MFIYSNYFEWEQLWTCSDLFLMRVCAPLSWSFFYFCNLFFFITSLIYHNVLISKNKEKKTKPTDRLKMRFSSSRIHINDIKYFLFNYFSFVVFVIKTQMKQVEIEFLVFEFFNEWWNKIDWCFSLLVLSFLVSWNGIEEI
jgi:hypothetical protein